MSAQYGVDFSTAKPGMRLADFADEVRAQKGNLGSFDELLKTVDPKQSGCKNSRSGQLARAACLDPPLPRGEAGGCPVGDAVGDRDTAARVPAC